MFEIVGVFSNRLQGCSLNRLAFQLRTDLREQLFQAVSIGVVLDHFCPSGSRDPLADFVAGQAERQLVVNNSAWPLPDRSLVTSSDPQANASKTRILTSSRIDRLNTVFEAE